MISIEKNCPLVHTCNFVYGVHTLCMKISEKLLSMGFYFCIAYSLRSNYCSMAYTFPL